MKELMWAVTGLAIGIILGAMLMNMEADKRFRSGCMEACHPYQPNPADLARHDVLRCQCEGP